jgi:arginine/ornithine N-succinyltransferase beta subunit
MQHDQQMFCHAKCFIARLQPSVKLYAAFLAEQGADEVTGSAFTPTEE